MNAFTNSFLSDAPLDIGPNDRAVVASPSVIECNYELVAYLHLSNATQQFISSFWSLVLRLTRGASTHTPNISRRPVERLMKAHDSAILVAEEENCDGTKTVVGCVQAEWSTNGLFGVATSDTGATLSYLAVPKKFRRRGIGRLLVHAAGNLLYYIEGSSTNA